MKKYVPSAEPIYLDSFGADIVTAWNMMSSKMDWQALDAIIEFMQVVDVEMFIDGLLILHDYNNNK